MDTGMVMLGHCTIQLLCCSVPLLNMCLYGFHSGYESELKQTLLKCINLLHFLQHICLYYPSTLSLWGLVFHCQMYLERPNMDQSFLLRFKTPTSSPTENNVDNKDSDSSVYFSWIYLLFIEKLFFPPVVTCHGICRLKWHCGEVQPRKQARVGGVSRCVPGMRFGFIKSLLFHVIMFNCRVVFLNSTSHA